MAFQFWCVWEPHYGTPTVKHCSKDVAIKEARRLATEHPGRIFYLMQAMASYQKTDVAVTELDPPRDGAEIPF